MKELTPQERIDKLNKELKDQGLYLEKNPEDKTQVIIIKNAPITQQKRPKK